MKSSKFNIKDLWEELYGNSEQARDYTGTIMYKSACGNRNSSYEPTIDHIRPLSKGGKDVKGNIIICHRETNFEKADSFPHWNANERNFRAKRVKGTKTDYEIEEI